MMEKGKMSKRFIIPILTAIVVVFASSILKGQLIENSTDTTENLTTQPVHEADSPEEPVEEGESEVAPILFGLIIILLAAKLE